MGSFRFNAEAGDLAPVCIMQPRIEDEDSVYVNCTSVPSDLSSSKDGDGLL